MLFFCPEPFYDRDAPPACRLGSRAAALVLQPENLTGGLPHSDVDQSIARHDGTFFDKNMGALSAYAKGVLVANAAWAAWSTLILLLSW